MASTAASPVGSVRPGGEKEWEIWECWELYVLSVAKRGRGRGEQDGCVSAVAENTKM
jgi:hypothetical protein